jgi:hypothetical protein
MGAMTILRQRPLSIRVCGYSGAVGGVFIVCEVVQTTSGSTSVMGIFQESTRLRLCQASISLVELSYGRTEVSSRRHCGMPSEPAASMPRDGPTCFRAFSAETSAAAVEPDPALIALLATLS